MKKGIILVVFLLFLTSGCYDYTELNQIAIISGISIDYQNDEFYMAFEILNTKKEEEKDQEKVYIAKGHGKTIAEAFSDASLEIAKTPYLAHLEVVILSEDIARNHVKEIVDFFIRDNYVRNIFYLVMAKDTTAFEILNNTDVNNPIVSNAIKQLIDNNSYVNNISAKLNYETFIESIIDKRKDTYITSIKIENDILKLGPLAVFKDYNMQGYLSEDESATFNIINNTTRENYFKLSCPDEENKIIILSSYLTPKSGIEIKDNTATISTEIETRISENHCNLDFKDTETYVKLQNILEEKIKKDMEETLQTLINYKSDALGINQTYYQKYKKSIDFTELNYKFKVTAYVNRNGLVFEVKQ